MYSDSEIVLGSEKDSFTYLLIHSCNEDLLSVHCVSGTVLGIAENNFWQDSCGTCLTVGETDETHYIAVW